MFLIVGLNVTGSQMVLVALLMGTYAIIFSIAYGKLRARIEEEALLSRRQA